MRNRLLPNIPANGNRSLALSGDGNTLAMGFPLSDDNGYLGSIDGSWTLSSQTPF